jgi:tight adherence protein C
MLRLLGGLCAGGAMACLLGALTPPRRAIRPARAELDFIRGSTREPALPPAPAAVARRLLRRIARRLRLREGPVRTWDLPAAGLEPAAPAPEEVLALKLVCGVAIPVALLPVAALLPGALLLLPAAAWAGFLLPSLWLRRRRRRRQARVRSQLPDLVGLLRAFLAAQVPFEQALHLISAQLADGDPGNVLAPELRRALGDYGLGHGIDESLSAMADRLGTDELHGLVAAMAQGRRLGRGMEMVLHDQELLLRMGQRNHATAAASQVSTRLMGVLVAVYLPEFVILILVPLLWGVIVRLGP